MFAEDPPKPRRRIVHARVRTGRKKKNGKKKQTAATNVQKNATGPDGISNNSSGAISSVDNSSSTRSNLLGANVSRPGGAKHLVIRNSTTMASFGVEDGDASLGDRIFETSHTARNSSQNTSKTSTRRSLFGVDTLVTRECHTTNESSDAINTLSILSAAAGGAGEGGEEQSRTSGSSQSPRGRMETRRLVRLWLRSCEINDVEGSAAATKTENIEKALAQRTGYAMHRSKVRQYVRRWLKARNGVTKKHASKCLSTETGGYVLVSPVTSTTASIEGHDSRRDSSEATIKDEVRRWIRNRSKASASAVARGAGYVLRDEVKYAESSSSDRKEQTRKFVRHFIRYKRPGFKSNISQKRVVDGVAEKTGGYMLRHATTLTGRNSPTDWKSTVRRWIREKSTGRDESIAKHVSKSTGYCLITEALDATEVAILSKEKTTSSAASEDWKSAIRRWIRKKEATGEEEDLLSVGHLVSKSTGYRVSASDWKDALRCTIRDDRSSLRHSAIVADIVSDATGYALLRRANDYNRDTGPSRTVTSVASSLRHKGGRTSKSPSADARAFVRILRERKGPGSADLVAAKIDASSKVTAREVIEAANCMFYENLERTFSESFVSDTSTTERLDDLRTIQEQMSHIRKKLAEMTNKFESASKESQTVRMVQNRTLCCLDEMKYAIFRTRGMSSSSSSPGSQDDSDALSRRSLSSAWRKRIDRIREARKNYRDARREIRNVIRVKERSACFADFGEVALDSKREYLEEENSLKVLLKTAEGNYATAKMFSKLSHSSNCARRSTVAAGSDLFATGLTRIVDSNDLNKKAAVSKRVVIRRAIKLLRSRGGCMKQREDASYVHPGPDSSRRSMNREEEGSTKVENRTEVSIADLLDAVDPPRRPKEDKVDKIDQLPTFQFVEKELPTLEPPKDDVDVKVESIRITLDEKYERSLKMKNKGVRLTIAPPGAPEDTLDSNGGNVDTSGGEKASSGVSSANKGETTHGKAITAEMGRAFPDQSSEEPSSTTPSLGSNLNGGKEDAFGGTGANAPSGTSSIFSKTKQGMTTGTANAFGEAAPSGTGSAVSFGMTGLGAGGGGGGGGSGGSLRSALGALYNVVDQSKLSKVDQTLQRYAGRLP
eukprot:g3085.t1